MDGRFAPHTRLSSVTYHWPKRENTMSSEPHYEIQITWPKELGSRPTNDGHQSVTLGHEEYCVFDADGRDDVEFLCSCLKPGLKVKAHIVGQNLEMTIAEPVTAGKKRGRKPGKRAKTATLELTHPAEEPQPEAPHPAMETAKRKGRGMNKDPRKPHDEVQITKE